MSLRVDPEFEGSRIDVWLARQAGIRRGEVQRMIDAGLVTIEGSPVNKSTKVKSGQVVEYRVLERTDAVRPLPPFAVRYEDEHIAVVFKPAGVVVHPGSGYDSGTLVDALSSVMPLTGGDDPSRPGIVHRLDKDTSGLLVVTKDEIAYTNLMAMMKAHEVERTYIALVSGTLSARVGRIEAPIARSSKDPTRRAVDPEGKAAATDFKVLESFEQTSLVRVRLLTGRTHQIRVHMAHIGHPIMGDRVYAPKTLPAARRLGLQRPFLHAARLRFEHPVTHAEIDVSEELPKDLSVVLQAVRPHLP